MAPAVVQPTMTSRFAGLFASRRGVLAPASSAGTRAPVAPLSPRRLFPGASLGGFGLRAWSRARWPIASPPRASPRADARTPRDASRADPPTPPSGRALAASKRSTPLVAAARDAVVRPAALGPFTALASDSDSDDDLADANDPLALPRVPVTVAGQKSLALWDVRRRRRRGAPLRPHGFRAMESQHHRAARVVACSPSPPPSGRSRRCPISSRRRNPPSRIA